MIYYTYQNPNRTGGITSWGDDADGQALELMAQMDQLRMREDENSEIRWGANGGGHACCKSATVIAHPFFVQVDAGGVDGASWWTDRDTDDAAAKIAFELGES